MTNKISNDKKTLIIKIGSQLVGFWLSVSKILITDYNVIIATDSYTKNKIEYIAKHHKVYDKIEIVEDLYKELVKDTLDSLDIIKESFDREKRYGKTFSLIISSDRTLGKGYNYNADKHPEVTKSWWTHEKKLGEILKLFLLWEHIQEKYKPALILEHVHSDVLGLISQYNGIMHLSLRMTKFGSYYMWINNVYNQNFHLIEQVKENAKKFYSYNDVSNVNYVQEHSSKYRHAQISYKTFGAIKRAISLFPGEFIRLITRYHKKNQVYKFLGWYGNIFYKVYIYKYFKKHGKRPEDLTNYDFVYVPLHMEPERALAGFSPEFNNSMEMIAWISKCLPADTLLVIKEQPHSYGIRSKHYYDNFRRIGNVVLAYPETSSWEWIKNSNLVATITGTAGIEAVYSKKPVISFGKYQLINHLPTVRYASNYETTKEAIKELMNLKENDSLFNVSMGALQHALMSISFELPGIEKIYGSRELHMDLAEVAVRSIKEQYNL